MKKALLLAGIVTLSSSSGPFQVAGAQDAQARAATSPAIDPTQRTRELRSRRELQQQILTAPVAPAESVAHPAAEAVPGAAARSPANDASVQAESSRPLTRLEAGRIYVVEPSPAKENTFRALVDPQMRTLAAGAPLATVSGIYRVAANNGNDVQFKPYVYVGSRLVYQQATRRYRGSIFVGVAALDSEAAAGGLSEPVVFQALDGGVDPDVLRVDTVGPPFRPMTVEVPSAQDAVTIRLLAKNAGGELSIAVPVAPTMRVMATNAEVQGYGLGTTRINVSMAGLPDPEGRLVTFRASPRGTFEPAQVKLDAQGNAGALLRSDGVGTVEISASSGDAAIIPDTVEFRPPVETLSATLFGGLLGAAIRVLPTLRAGSRGRAMLRLFIGMLVGLLGFALYAIGVNVTPLRPTVTQGAIVVFAMSAVFAYLGAKWLRALAPVSAR